MSGHELIVIVHTGLNSWQVAVASPDGEHYELVPLRFEDLRSATHWLAQLRRKASVQV